MLLHYKGKQKTWKVHYFHLNAACFLPKNTRNTLIYHLVITELPFTVKMIDWMHQAGPRILLSVTHMLYVNQVCHCVGRCVKDRSCSSSSLRESQWTVLVGCLTISMNVRRYQTHHRWQFFFQEDSALVHCACNTVQLRQRSRLMQHLSENVIFVFLVLPGSAEAQVTWGGILKHLLIAYFIDNISAKNIKICSCKAIGGTFFETRCSVLL